jgi:hypothetical protein
MAGIPGEGSNYSKRVQQSEKRGRDPKARQCVASLLELDLGRISVKVDTHPGEDHQRNNRANATAFANSVSKRQEECRGNISDELPCCGTSHYDECRDHSTDCGRNASASYKNVAQSVAHDLSRLSVGRPPLKRAHPIDIFRGCIVS